MAIELNDLLNLTETEIARSKCRFMVPSERIDFDPRKNVTTQEERDFTNLTNLVWQSEKKMYFHNGDLVIGFMRLHHDEWLLTGVLEILDENSYNQPAKAKYVDKCRKFEFRTVVKFHNNSQNCVRNAGGILPTLEVLEIWRPDKTINEQRFEGYENINLSWPELKIALSRDDWRTALKNQKGVYLITDTKTNKRYVGSAYGQEMLLGRWSAYVENGHGGNQALIKLIENEGFDYVKNNFRYTLLEIYRSTVNDDDIIERESYWKNILLTRKFGYNEN